MSYPTDDELDEAHRAGPGPFRSTRREATPGIQFVESVRFGISQAGRVALELNGVAYEFVRDDEVRGLVNGLERQLQVKREGRR